MNESKKPEMPVPMAPVESEKKQSLPEPPAHEEVKAVQPVVHKKPKMVMVMATRSGFFKNVRRREGDVFQVEEGKLGSWMKKV